MLCLMTAAPTFNTDKLSVGVSQNVSDTHTEYYTLLLNRHNRCEGAIESTKNILTDIKCIIACERLQVE